MIKLLDKPLRAFTIYAFIILIASIPVYFFIVDQIWIHEINEHNQLVSESIKENLAAQKFNDEELKKGIELWNRLQPETKIVQVETLKPDSTFNIYRENKYTGTESIDRFQGLVTYFRINNNNYSLTIEANIEESYETIFAITVITILFFVILLIGFIRLNKSISAKLWKPFYQTLEKIKTFDLNQQQHISFETSEIEEFEEMNMGINKLIAANIQAYKNQKEFTENASHELQTPLAILQSKLDLLQNSAINRQQSLIIEESNNALSRASRINKNLLLLAKIENQQFLDTETVTLLEILEDLLIVLADFMKDRITSLQVNTQLQVSGNKMLVEIMLINLLMNAVRHSEPGNAINISFNGRELKISNSGSAALNTDKLFRRFSSANKNQPGSGLGLSIIKKIANRYGWEIAYSFGDGLHTFSVKF